MIKDLILNRRSVRTFKDITIDDFTYNELINSIDNANKIFDCVNFKVFDAKKYNLKSNVTSDESLYIIGRVKKEKDYEIKFGYALEYLMLEITRLNLSSVFMAGTIDRAIFDDLYNFGDLMPGVLAVGVKSLFESKTERVLKRFLKADKKIELNKMCLGSNLCAYEFKNEKFKELFDIARFYPSAKNLAPVRIVIVGNNIHLFLSRHDGLINKLGDVQLIDLGIYIYNLANLLKEYRIDYDIKTMNVSNIDNLSYIKTITLKNSSEI